MVFIAQSTPLLTSPIFSKMREEFIGLRSEVSVKM